MLVEEGKKRKLDNFAAIFKIRHLNIGSIHDLLPLI
jgi:hypothetical protein